MVLYIATTIKFQALGTTYKLRHATQENISLVLLPPQVSCKPQTEQKSYFWLH